nr:S8 family serine peptidase [Porphyrobacter sp. GA68]
MPPPPLPPSTATPAIAAPPAPAVAVPDPRQPVAVPAAPQQRRSAADDEEYRANYFAAEVIGALYALNQGYDGTGVLVGVMDNGIAEVPELAGQISGLSRDFGTIHDVAGGRMARGSVGDARSDHGTPVAAIIAGRNDGLGIQGVAPGAKVVSLRVDYVLPDGSARLGEGMASALRHAADHGVLIVNRSIGRSNRGDAPSDFAAAVDYFGSKGGLLVQSTGNGGAPEPTELAEVTQTNRSSWLFVSALVQHGDGVIVAPYANHCGSVMDRCVMAMGENITQGSDGAIIRFSGTSSAAPQASALAALIMSKWPQLTGADAGNIILRTARDLGAPGLDPIYGAGLIDVQAALSPVDPVLSNGRTVRALGGSHMLISNAFGAAAIRASLGHAVLLDRFGRDFAADLSGSVVQLRPAAPAIDPATAQLKTSPWLTGDADAPLMQSQTWPAAQPQRFAAGAFRLPTGGRPTAFATIRRDRDGHPYLNGASKRVGILLPLQDHLLSVETHFGRSHNRRIHAVTARLSGQSAYIQTGLADEAGAVFGTPVGSGPLRFGDGAQTVFLAGGAQTGGAGWLLDAEAFVGLSRIKLADDLLLREVSAVASGQFNLTARAAWADGFLWAKLSQPLAITAGQASFRMPANFDRLTRTLIHHDAAANLRGRFDPQMTFGYSRSSPLGLVHVSATFQPGTGGTAALAGWSAALGGARW